MSIKFKLVKIGQKSLLNDLCGLRSPVTTVTTIETVLCVTRAEIEESFMNCDRHFSWEVGLRLIQELNTETGRL